MGLGNGGGSAYSPTLIGSRGIRAIRSPAATFGFGLGKGLREPCAPFRECMVFGAELGAPNADWWNCKPTIIEPTTSFDLSPLEPDHEVCVALSTFTNFNGPLNVTHRWYRNRDNQFLFEFIYPIPSGAWAWFYVYSYIGYVPQEIWEEGEYHVTISTDGSEVKTINFTVIGIALPPLTFYKGSLHTAHVTLHNPTQRNWVYTASVVIGGVAQDGWARVPINAGQTVTKDWPVAMPAEAGVYPVAVDVWEADREEFLGEFLLGDITIV